MSGNPTKICIWTNNGENKHSFSLTELSPGNLILDSTKSYYDLYAGIGKYILEIPYNKNKSIPIELAGTTSSEIFITDDDILLNYQEPKLTNTDSKISNKNHKTYFIKSKQDDNQLSIDSLYNAQPIGTQEQIKMNLIEGVSNLNPQSVIQKKLLEALNQAEAKNVKKSEQADQVTLKPPRLSLNTKKEPSKTPEPKKQKDLTLLTPKNVSYKKPIPTKSVSPIPNPNLPKKPYLVANKNKFITSPKIADKQQTKSVIKEEKLTNEIDDIEQPEEKLKYDIDDIELPEEELNEEDEYIWSANQYMDYLYNRIFAECAIEIGTVVSDSKNIEDVAAVLDRSPSRKEYILKPEFSKTSPKNKINTQIFSKILTPSSGPKFQNRTKSKDPKNLVPLLELNQHKKEKSRKEVCDERQKKKVMDKSKPYGQTFAAKTKKNVFLENKEETLEFESSEKTVELDKGEFNWYPVNEPLPDKILDELNSSIENEKKIDLEPERLSQQVLIESAAYTPSPHRGNPDTGITKRQTTPKNVTVAVATTEKANSKNEKTSGGNKNVAVPKKKLHMYKLKKNSINAGMEVEAKEDSLKEQESSNVDVEKEDMVDVKVNIDRKNIPTLFTPSIYELKSLVSAESMDGYESTIIHDIDSDNGTQVVSAFYMNDNQDNNTKNKKSLVPLITENINKNVIKNIPKGNDRGSTDQITALTISKGRTSRSNSRGKPVSNKIIAFGSGSTSNKPEKNVNKTKMSINQPESKKIAEVGSGSDIGKEHPIANQNIINSKQGVEDNDAKVIKIAEQPSDIEFYQASEQVIIDIDHEKISEPSRNSSEVFEDINSIKEIELQSQSKSHNILESVNDLEDEIRDVVIPQQQKQDKLDIRCSISIPEKLNHKNMTVIDNDNTYNVDTTDYNSIVQEYGVALFKPDCPVNLTKEQQNKAGNNMQKKMNPKEETPIRNSDNKKTETIQSKNKEVKCSKKSGKKPTLEPTYNTRFVNSQEQPKSKTPLGNSSGIKYFHNKTNSTRQQANTLKSVTARSQTSQSKSTHRKANNSQNTNHFVDNQNQVVSDTTKKIENKPAYKNEFLYKSEYIPPDYDSIFDQGHALYVDEKSNNNPSIKKNKWSKSFTSPREITSINKAIAEPAPGNSHNKVSPRYHNPQKKTESVSPTKLKSKYSAVNNTKPVPQQQKATAVGQYNSRKPQGKSENMANFFKNKQLKVIDVDASPVKNKRPPLSGKVGSKTVKNSETTKEKKKDFFIDRTPKETSGGFSKTQSYSKTPRDYKQPDTMTYVRESQSNHNRANYEPIYAATTSAHNPSISHTQPPILNKTEDSPSNQVRHSQINELCKTQQTPYGKVTTYKSRRPEEKPDNQKSVDLSIYKAPQTHIQSLSSQNPGNSNNSNVVNISVSKAQNAPKRQPDMYHNNYQKSPKIRNYYEKGEPIIEESEEFKEVERNYNSRVKNPSLPPDEITLDQYTKQVPVVQHEEINLIKHYPKTEMTSNDYMKPTTKVVQPNVLITEPTSVYDLNVNPKKHISKIETTENLSLSNINCIGSLPNWDLIDREIQETKLKSQFPDEKKIPEKLQNINPNLKTPRGESDARYNKYQVANNEGQYQQAKPQGQNYIEFHESAGGYHYKPKSPERTHNKKEPISYRREDGVEVLKISKEQFDKMYLNKAQKQPATSESPTRYRQQQEYPNQQNKVIVDQYGKPSYLQKTHQTSETHRTHPSHQTHPTYQSHQAYQTHHPEHVQHNGQNSQYHQSSHNMQHQQSSQYNELHQQYPSGNVEQPEKRTNLLEKIDHKSTDGNHYKGSHYKNQDHGDGGEMEVRERVVYQDDYRAKTDRDAGGYYTQRR